LLAACGEICCAVAALLRLPSSTVRTKVVMERSSLIDIIPPIRIEWL
jgi:hypothetical protein